MAVSNQSVRINGDLTYDYRHAVAYGEALTYTPAVTQNVYTKLTPTLTTSEADGITIAGDSIKIIKTGDYYVNVVCTFSGANGNDWRLKLYRSRSGVLTAVSGSNHVTSTGASNYVTLNYFWYVVDAAVDDGYSFRMTNTTNNDDPTITDF